VALEFTERHLNVEPDASGREGLNSGFHVRIS
jgi:hypothetical protein